MGMIRVSDDAEKQIKGLAKERGVTITAAVDALLARNDVGARFDKMASWLKSYLDTMKKDIVDAIGDTTIDRIDTCTPKRGRIDRALDFQTEVWPIFYELLQENDPAWLPGAYQAAHESSDMAEANYFVDFDKGVIFSIFYGNKVEWVHLTPEVERFLNGD